MNDNQRRYEVHEKEVRLPGGKFFAPLTQVIIYLIPAAFILNGIWMVIALIPPPLWPVALVEAAAGVIWFYGAYVTGKLFWSPTTIKEVILDEEDNYHSTSYNDDTSDDDPPSAS